MASLVITQDCISVRSEGERLVLIKHRIDPDSAEEHMSVPLFDIDRVCVLGCPMVTMAVLHKLMRNNIPVTFLSAHGQWLGGLYSEDKRDAARRISQYELFHDLALRQKIAARLIYAKVRNSRRVLQRLAIPRQCTDSLEQQKALITLRRIARIVKERRCSLESLRGWEGMAAACYFERLNDFFPPEVPFGERSRRPPGNAANALLSWTYAIVQGEIDGAVRRHGLDVCIGALHTVSHGMPSLVLDLLEPLRAPLCDMLALHLLNHKILKQEDFERHEDDGGTYLKTGSRKKFFQSYEQAMTRKFTLPGGAYHVDFRKVIDMQVCTMLKALQGQWSDSDDFFLMP